MKKILFLFIAVCIAISAAPVQAQTLDFNDILKVYVRSSGYIKKEKQVTGYYYLYNVDKIDKKTNLYRLVIADADLNKVAEKRLEGPSDLRIVDATYNGDLLAIKFVNFNRKSESQMIRFFDNKAEEQPSKSYPYDIAATYQANAMNDGADLETSDLHALDGIGFLNFSAIQTKGGMYKRTGVSIDMIPFADGYSAWNYSSPEKSIEIPDYLGSNKEVAFVSLMKKSNIMSRDVTFSIAGLDLRTGKVKFDKEFTDDKYLLDIISINPLNDKETLFFGSLNEDDKKAARSKSLGMFIAKVDNNGNMGEKSTFFWKDVAKDFNPVDEKGNSIDIGNVYIHRVLQTSDGRIFAFGERFYKAASALGIATNVLSGLSGSSPRASVVKIVVAEFVIIELGSNLKPISVQFINKDKNSVELPAGAGMLGSAVLGPYTKAIGGFDFMFLQEFEGKEGFTVAYRSKEKKVGYVNTVSYYEGQTTTDKISLKTESSRLWVSPGKAGYIQITEYFKKEKRLTSRLEKVKI